MDNIVRISTDQETLQRGLNVVARAVATRSTLPQTSHICIATDDGRLKLSATNLEIAITTGSPPASKRRARSRSPRGC